MSTPTLHDTADARAAGLHALTHSPSQPGIDWAELERQRLTLARLHLSGRIDCGSDPANSEAIEGLLNALDWLTDLAEGAGLLDRTRKGRGQ